MKMDVITECVHLTTLRVPQNLALSVFPLRFSGAQAARSSYDFNLGNTAVKCNAHVRDLRK